jgi:hypothetical protein
LARPAHLAKRFAGSLWPGGPSAAGEDWATGWLLPTEVTLWRRMSGADRRHALGVARRVADALGPAGSRAVMAAALLHDVGKVESGLGTFGRVAATLAPTTGRFAEGPRVAAYRAHDRLGADLLAAAGSDPLTVRWARQHHLPPEQWSVPAALAMALKAADDD